MAVARLADKCTAIVSPMADFCSASRPARSTSGV